MSNNTCAFCDEDIDEDDTYHCVWKTDFEQNGHGSVHLVNTIIRDACEDCHDGNTFACSITDEYYADSEFTAGDNNHGDTVCVEAAQAAGYIATSDGEWILPAEPTLSKDKNVSEFVDFYWQLKDGERHGVLQKDGGGEVDMPKSLEKKIYHRIEEAGADSGDPNVVNTYTRLQLIDDKILPESYTL